MDNQLLGNIGSVNPPKSSPCWHCWFGDSRAYSMCNGGGGGKINSVTIEGLEDVNRSIRALGALIENIAVSLGIEIKTAGFLPEDQVVNSFTAKSPVEGMEQETAMGSREPCVSGEVWI